MAVSCIVLAHPASWQARGLQGTSRGAPSALGQPTAQPPLPPPAVLPTADLAQGEGSLIAQCLPVWRSTLQTGLVNHHPWETGQEKV